MLQLLQRPNGLFSRNVSFITSPPPVFECHGHGMVVGERERGEGRDEKKYPRPFWQWARGGGRPTQPAHMIFPTHLMFPVFPPLFEKGKPSRRHRKWKAQKRCWRERNSCFLTYVQPRTVSKYSQSTCATYHTKCTCLFWPKKQQETLNGEKSWVSSSCCSTTPPPSPRVTQISPKKNTHMWSSHPLPTPKPPLLHRRSSAFPLCPPSFCEEKLRLFWGSVASVGNTGFPKDLHALLLQVEILLFIFKKLFSYVNTRPWFLFEHNSR